MDGWMDGWMMMMMRRRRRRKETKKKGGKEADLGCCFPRKGGKAMQSEAKEGRKDARKERGRGKAEGEGEGEAGKTLARVSPILPAGQQPARQTAGWELLAEKDFFYKQSERAKERKSERDELQMIGEIFPSSLLPSFLRITTKKSRRAALFCLIA